MPVTGGTARIDAAAVLAEVDARRDELVAPDEHVSVDELLIAARLYALTAFAFLFDDDLQGGPPWPMQ